MHYKENGIQQRVFLANSAPPYNYESGGPRQCDRGYSLSEMTLIIKELLALS